MSEEAPLARALCLWPHGPKIWAGRLHGRRAVLAKRRRVWWLLVEGPRIGPVTLMPGKGPGGVLLGDPSFDGGARAFGPPALVRAALDEPFRRAAESAFEAGILSIKLSARGLALSAPLDWPEEAAAAARPAIGPLMTGASSLGGTMRALLGVALFDPEIRVRIGAGEALLEGARRLDEDAAARVCAALALSSSVRPRVRIDAMWDLSRIAPGLMPWILLRFLQSPSPELIRFAVERLGDLGLKGAVPALGRLAYDERADLAAEAVRALGRLEAVELEDLLLERLFAGDVSVRRAAAEALGALGRGPRVMRALTRLSGVRGEERSVREAARAALRVAKTRMAPRGALALAGAHPTGGLALASEVAEAPDAGAHSNERPCWAPWDRTTAAPRRSCGPRLASFRGG